MTPAETRRRCICDLLRENGPCLSNFLAMHVKSRTKQPLVAQQINADIDVLVKQGLVTKKIVMGLGPAVGFSRPPGQKMILVTAKKKVEDKKK